MGNKVFPKRFDMDVRRPVVLLFGNGMVRCTGETPDWTRVIEELAVSDLDPEKIASFPYSIRATVTMDPNDIARRNAYLDFFENRYQYSPNPLIAELMDIHFDAVLTTNYTYELEYALKPNYPILRSKTQYAHVLDYIPEKIHSENPEEGSSGDDPVRMSDARGMRTFNRINGQDIWHIHGEIRRRDSFILTHDEYGRLMGAILKYNRLRGKNIGEILYGKNEDGTPRKKEINFCSWFDYFVYGDLYIVGQGFDFAEFDLWWLLSRRQRARQRFGSGNAVFFTPFSTDGRPTPIEMALSALDVRIQHCDVRLSGDPDEDAAAYRELYARVVGYIRREVSSPDPEEAPG